MATVFTDDIHYKNIADAIRAKNGTTTKYMPSDMSAAIEAIETKPTLQEKIITPSTLVQEVTPDEGYVGLSNVFIEPISYTSQENVFDGITIYIGSQGSGSILG